VADHVRRGQPRGANISSTRFGVDSHTGRANVGDLPAVLPNGFSEENVIA
jgi:hypothetical protein